MTLPLTLISVWMFLVWLSVRPEPDGGPSSAPDANASAGLITGCAASQAALISAGVVFCGSIFAIAGMPEFGVPVKGAGASVWRGDINPDERALIIYASMPARFSARILAAEAKIKS